MTKSELKTGMICTLRDGRVCFCIKDSIHSGCFGLIELNQEGVGHITLEAYKDDLTGYNRNNDIVKVEMMEYMEYWGLLDHIVKLYKSNPLKRKLKTYFERVK